MRNTVSPLSAGSIGSDRPPEAPGLLVHKGVGAGNAMLVFGYPREFAGNRFVYAVISPRARGLSIGVNMNPDKHCNFDCRYCEVLRAVPATGTTLDVDVMSVELQRMLEMAHTDGLRALPCYEQAPVELLRLRHVALSGDGEPTLCPNFAEAVQSVVHVRALGRFPFFRLVLITNGSGLHLPPVQQGLNSFTQRDEVWVKLDAGTQGYLDRIDRPDCSLDEILANIRLVGRHRPVTIQSLFPTLHGEEPPAEEIEAYARRLLDLSRHGVRISLVQIYSATRPMPHSECGHLSLKSLSRIARRVRDVSGLRAEVF